MRVFQLGPDVHANVRALRQFLGSVDEELSYARLASQIERRHSAKIGASKVQRWEKDGVEPDIESIRIMADLAGVSYEAFARGTNAALGTDERVARVNRLAADIAEAERAGDRTRVAESTTRYVALVRDTFAAKDPALADTLAEAFLSLNRESPRRQDADSDDATLNRL